MSFDHVQQWKISTKIKFSISTLQNDTNNVFTHILNLNKKVAYKSINKWLI